MRAALWALVVLFTKALQYGALDRAPAAGPVGRLAASFTQQLRQSGFLAALPQLLNAAAAALNSTQHEPALAQLPQHQFDTWDACTSNSGGGPAGADAVISMLVQSKIPNADAWHRQDAAQSSCLTSGSTCPASNSSSNRDGVAIVPWLVSLGRCCLRYAGMQAMYVQQSQGGADMLWQTVAPEWHGTVDHATGSAGGGRGAACIAAGRHHFSTVCSSSIPY